MISRNTQKVLLQIAVLAGATMLATSAYGAELTLRGDMEVIEDTIYLSDVFNGVPLDTDGILARSPAPGERELFRVHDLEDAAERAGHTWANDERVRRVTITRASHAVEADEIATLIERTLVAEGYGDRFNVNLSNRSYVLHLPLDQAPSVAIERLQHDARTGYFEVSLSAPGLGSDLAPLRGRATAVLEIPVLSSQLPINTEISASDINYIEVAADRLSQGMVLDASELIGMAPHRNVRAGQPVRRSDIGALIVAEQGSRLRIAYQVPGMSLTVIGEALEDGALGEVIRIRNTTTHNVFEARILGPGTAEAIPSLAASPLTVSMN